MLRRRPLSRAHSGQTAFASPPMSLETILMTSWRTTLSYSIVCHAWLQKTTCDRGVRRRPVGLPTPSVQWWRLASTYTQQKSIAAATGVSHSPLTARIALPVMRATPLVFALTESPTSRQPTVRWFLV